MQITLGDIRKALNIPCDKNTDDIVITGVSKNSKTVKKNELFVPLRGARFDGHDFIPSAVEAGASAVLCDRNDMSFDIPTLRVQDTLSAVQQLAGWYMSTLSMKKVGVTGSTGKTTTSIMIRCALSKKLNVFKTEDDMNGQIGMTFSAFDMNDTYDAAVLEMGMSQYGELSRLTKIARPDIAVINMIGSAHIEFFGSKENILKAKLEIMEGLKPDGLAVLNGDDDLLWGIRGKIPNRTIYYGLYNSEADVKGEYIGYKDGCEVFSYDGHEFRIPAKGTHYVQNALAAIAVGRELGLSDDEIAAGLADFKPAKGRQRMYDANGYHIIEDCYNASPEAVKASMGVLKSMEAKRKIAVLADMLELGDHAPKAHLECGNVAANCCDMIFAYGENAKYYLEGAKQSGMSENNMFYFKDRTEMAEKLKITAEKGDMLLFKGSHSMKLEEVLEKFLNA